MYELTFLVNPNVSQDELADILKQIKDNITRHEGQIIRDFTSKKISLAYPIKKLRQGFLISIEFNLDRAKINAVKNLLKDTKNILRFLLISKKPLKVKAVRLKPAKPVIKAKPREKIKIEELDKKIEEILEE